MDVIDALINLPRKEIFSAAPMSSQLAPWIALTRVKGLGCVSCKNLISHFGDARRIFAASAAELSRIAGVSQEAVDCLLAFDGWKEVDRELERIRSAGLTAVTYADVRYPERLRTIADPPPVLYFKGELVQQDHNAVAIVGSRSASDYGRRVARDLARGLAHFGFTVVSGMARGIDGMAHEAALAAGGRTLAVLGSGADQAYPPEHAQLYQRITAQGAVLSELPVGTRPLAYNFPARNRLISGLSVGVIVVEATEKSGSLITASFAVEQGREVFAVPGEVGSSRSRGSHKLIRQGAKLVETVSDVVEEIAPQLAQGNVASPERPRLPDNTPAETRSIFALLEESALQIDQVIERSGLTPAKVSQILLELELHGFLRQLPGKRYTVQM